MTPYAASAQRLSDVTKLPDPSADLYPARRNKKYKLDRPITDEKDNGNYNNFYQFGTSKTIATTVQAVAVRPWKVKIEAMVENPSSGERHVGESRGSGQGRTKLDEH